VQFLFSILFIKKLILHMKKLLLLFSLIFLTGLLALSQTVDITGNAGTSGTPGLGTSNYVANESIYTETEIGASNFTTAATAINKIGLNISTVGTPTTFGSVKIYAKEIPLATTAFAAAGVYTNVGYTLLYSGSVVAAASGWVEVSLTTPFQRTSGNNLQILIERTDAATHTGYVWRTANGNNLSATANTARRYNAATALSGTTSLALSAFRAQIRFKHEFPNDALVKEVYSLGKLPFLNVTPHTISASILNNGSNTLTSLPVTLSVTGGTSFTDVQTIASLAPGASATVTFASYAPAAVGNDNISVTIPADDDNSNNAKSLVQQVNTNTWSYAYGNVPSGAVGFTGNAGDFVAKFNTIIATTLSQVSVNFNTGGQPYKIAVWDATGAGGTPGTLLFETASLTSLSGVNVIPFATPVSITAGSFYIGVRQTGTVNVSFSYQTEAPIRPNTFYFFTPASGVWTDFSPTNSFKFMIEPKLQLPIDASVSEIVLPYNANVTCYGNSETVTAKITNAGSSPIAPSTATLTLKIGGANPQTLTMMNSTSIASGANEIVTFTGVNFLNAGTNFDTVFVNLSGDLEKGNDTTKTSHSTTTVISSFPSVEDVEAAALTSFKWVNTVTGTRQLWGIRSTPYTNADQTAALNPHSGTKFMLFDAYSGASSLNFTSRYFSDCFSIPAGGCPYEVSFWMSHDNTTVLPELDSLYVSVSTNKGLTWVRQTIVGVGAGLQRADATLTANAAPIWRKNVVDLSAFAGQTIQIGFEGVSKYGNAFGLDDITVGSAAANKIALETGVNTYALSPDCDDMGWTYYKDAVSNNVLAVEWGTNAASKAAATASLTLDATNYAATAGSGALATATFTMKRYWNIDVAGVQPTTPVNVRFFYDAAEKAAVDAAALAYQTANSGSTLEVPRWFKTTAGTFVGDAAHVSAIGVLNGLFLTDANTGGATINGVLYAQFNGVISFSGGTYASGVGPNTVLPIGAEYLKGTKQALTHVLDWKVTCTAGTTLLLSLERSGDGRIFSSIQDQSATDTRCLQAFNYVDATPLVGANYYRVKITSPDGSFKYSSIVLLLNKEKGFELISVAPNPLKDNAVLTLTSAKAGKINLLVSDLAGKIIEKKIIAVFAGNNVIDVNFATYGAGTYTIVASSAEGETKTMKFVKY
jgi:CARDB